VGGRIIIWTGLVLLMVSIEVGWAATSTKKKETAADPVHPYRQCLLKAAQSYQLHPRLLTAIVRVENGGWNPLAVSINQNGRGYPQSVRSYQEAVKLVTRLWKQNVNFDVGLGQVNSINMERYRVHPVVLLEPCTNLRYAARILRESIDRHGYNWKAIERYNGVNPQYPWKVMKELQGVR
jgi:soluble lytic murein transglycosylase-like protein